MPNRDKQEPREREVTIMTASFMRLLCISQLPVTPISTYVCDLANRFLTNIIE
jgi:hypothetical protein